MRTERSSTHAAIPDATPFELASHLDKICLCLHAACLVPIIQLDDDFRAKQGKPPLDHLWNFWISVVLAMIFAIGIMFVGFSFTIQLGAVGLENRYVSGNCSVSSYQIAQKNVNGYLDTHWALYNLTAEYANVSYLGVSGVAGGWPGQGVERYPLPPAYGAITEPHEGESIFSNNVAINASYAAFMTRQYTRGGSFPCLIPLSDDGKTLRVLSPVEMLTPCGKPLGMYPFDDAVEQMKLATGSTSKCDGEDVIGYTAQASLNEPDTERESNSGADHVACPGRIVFLDATFAKLDPIVMIFTLQLMSGFFMIFLGPIVCACSRGIAVSQRLCLRSCQSGVSQPPART